MITVKIRDLENKAEHVIAVPVDDASEEAMHRAAIMLAVRRHWGGGVHFVTDGLTKLPPHQGRQYGQVWMRQGRGQQTAVSGRVTIDTE